jgi:hypothetical protein
VHSWPIRERILLQLAGMRDFVWLHAGKDGAEASPPAESPMTLIDHPQKELRIDHGWK